MSSAPKMEPFDQAINEALEAERALPEGQPDLPQMWSVMEHKIAGYNAHPEVALEAGRAGSNLISLSKGAAALWASFFLSVGVAGGIFFDRVLNPTSAATQESTSVDEVSVEERQEVESDLQEPPEMNEISIPSKILPGAETTDDGGPSSPDRSSEEDSGASLSKGRRIGRPQPTDTLTEERRLLDVARAALRAGNPGEAIEAIQRHQQRFERGLLTEERESLQIHALMGIGRAAEARQRARDFAQSFPNSVFIPRINAILEERE